MYEVWYGAALLIFFSSLINKRFYNTTWQLLGVAIASVTLLFSYPMMIVGLIFILLYHFLEIRKVPMKLAAILGIVCIFWLVWKILFLSEYETGKIGYPLSQITKIAKENFGSVTNIITLITFLIRIYTEEIIAFLIVTTMLIFRRKYELALLVGFFIGGFILLVNLTQNTPWHHSNYFERLYLLLVPMCLIPFLHEVYEPAYKKLIFEVIFVCIIFWRGIQIFHHSDYYSTRISQVEFFIDQANKMNGSKFFVDEQKYSGNSALNEWSFPMETLILSSLKRNESVTISLKSDIENIENSSRLMPDNFHLRLNEILKIEELNRNYFRLERGNYQNLDTK